MQLFNIITFLTVFFYITHRLTFKLFINSYLKPKKSIKKIVDTELSQLIKKKTAVEIKEIRIINSPQLFGGMSGIPGMPILMLSKGLYEKFNKGELEYVVLHETGHYVYWHPLKEVLITTFFVLIGLFTTNYILYALFLGFILGILFIIVMRFFEYQADNYALNLLTDRQNMISATKKFSDAWKGPQKGIVRLLFYRGIPYEKRIEMARGKVMETP